MIDRSAAESLCPNCGHEGTASHTECPACGVVYKKFAQRLAKQKSTPAEDRVWEPYDPALRYLLGSRQQVLIEQQARGPSDQYKPNLFRLLSAEGHSIGALEARHVGFSASPVYALLGSHRSIEVWVSTGKKQLLMLSRPAYMLRSRLQVKTAQGLELGSVQRRPGIFEIGYDLCDPNGRVFAVARRSGHQPGVFELFTEKADPVAKVAKVWAGLRKELLTKADNFVIDFGNEAWTPAQRTVLLGLAVSIDDDFYHRRK